MMHIKPFLFSITLLLAFAVVTDANALENSTPHHRDHASLNRLIKKRALGPPVVAGVLDASSTAAASPQPTDSAAILSPVATSTTDKPSDTVTSPSASATANSATSPAVTNPPATSSASATTTSASGLGGILGPLFNTSSSSSSASTSTSVLPTTTSASTTSATPTSVSKSPGASSSISRASDVTVVVTGSATQSSTSATSTSSTSSATIKHATEVVLIIIAACVGGAVVVWTIIRKWKFRPSANFEDRMQPIDWQPTDDNNALPHRRHSGSSSFHSHTDVNYAGQGGGASYAGSDHNHGPAHHNPIPDHDFTAGNAGYGAGLAPVGDYADLARGPSPQPQMQEALSRGPSVNRLQYDQYGVPLHHGGFPSQEPYARY